MTEMDRSKDEDSYSTIKTSDEDDTYLEAMSGDKPVQADVQETTCSKCGLTARTKEELQDHINHAHNRENSTRNG
jgi:hypothetical protein